jgi:hypothetical protein
VGVLLPEHGPDVDALGQVGDGVVRGLELGQDRGDGEDGVHPDDVVLVQEVQVVDVVALGVGHGVNLKKLYTKSSSFNIISNFKKWKMIKMKYFVFKNLNTSSFMFTN